MPHLQDPYFGNSIVLICEHSNDGALGLIINKPFEKPELKVLFQKLPEDQDKIIKIIPKVYFGGPVLIERGIVIHSSSYNSEDMMEISDEFAITSSRKILQDIADGNGPKQYKLMLGHAGWEAGQLEYEIKQNSWVTLPVNSSFVFDDQVSNKWNEAYEMIGFDPTSLSHFSGNA